MADASRLPPYDLDAEQGVLAACLVDRDMAVVLAGLLKPGHFFRDAHGLIFGAIVRLVDAGHPVDFLTVKDELGARLDDAGGFGYLVDLQGTIPTTAHAERYAAIIRDKATLRSLAAAGAAIAEGALDPDANAAEMHARAVGLVDGLEVADELSEDMGDFLAGYVERLEARGQAGGGLHFESAWYDLDQVWTGARGDLVILAARPAMGKTAWAMNYAWHVAQASRVDFYSLEMDRDRLMDRLVVMLEGVEYKRLKTGDLRYYEWEAVERVRAKVAASGLHILKPKALTAATVRQRTLKAKARGIGPGLVVVDYLQLMSHPRADRNDLSIAATTRALKLMAGELGVQMMCLAQLNRNLAKENNRRPALTDLRDSGAIEQDADAVIFLHREAYFDAAAEQTGPCETIVAKHRNGSIGNVALHFQPDRQLFSVPRAELPADPAWSLG